MFSRSCRHHRTLWERACSRCFWGAQCTDRMHHEPQSRTTTDPKPRLHLQKNPYRKNTKAPNHGAFSAVYAAFCFNLLKTGMPPAIVHSVIRFTTQFRGPWYRQAGDSPLYTGLIPQLRRAHPVLGSLVQAGRGFPLYTGLTPQCASPPVWEPWYRQAGDSLFYCSRRWISSRQRSSTSLPAHSPCSGRAATTVSNNPPSLKRVRQFTSLPLSLS